jgi:hypothetical protein
MSYGVAVDGRHHRARHTTRDAAVVEAAVLPGVRGSAATRLPCQRARIRRLLAGSGQRRDTAIRRIDEEPGAAVLRVVVLVPVHRSGPRVGAADPRGTGERTLLTLAHDLRELGVVHIVGALAGELARPLHRNAVLILVGIGPLQIGVAPRRFRWHIGGRGLDRGGRGG